MRHFFLAAALLHAFASANDGIAGVSAGGIVFRKTDAIAMKKEVLNVSHKLISVDYEFVNESAQDVEETIVFPLPAYPAVQQMSDSYYGQPNGFSISVNGQPVKFTTRVIALLEKEDVTAQLKKAGLTDAQIAFNPELASAAKVPALTAAQEKTLAAAGLYGELSDGDQGPLWQIQVNYVWKQRFPVNQVVKVHHAYRPFYTGGPGASYMDKEVAQQFCADKDFFNAYNKIVTRRGNDHMRVAQVSYILKTGNTWKRGIEDFTLNIVKGGPGELVSLCFPGTFKKINATTYQIKVRNFQPTRDLEVYFGNIAEADVTDNTGVAPVLSK